MKTSMLYSGAKFRYIQDGEKPTTVIYTLVKLPLEYDAWILVTDYDNQVKTKPILGQWCEIKSSPEHIFFGWESHFQIIE